MLSHKNYKNSWIIPEDFPQLDVIKAFLLPDVITEVKLEWNEPSYDNLKTFCDTFLPMDEIGFEIMINPLKEEFKRRASKITLIDYFNRGEVTSVG